jgi:4-amino-4-deoxy-L-arabinose transferase-like glycosyltransferase
VDRLRRPGIPLVLAALAVFAVTVLVVQFTGLTDRPRGYFVDESSFSWNAWTIDMAGVDEHGRPMPLFFEAFGDWKTAPYIYLLAAVFAVTGPSILAARVVSAVAGVLTIAFLGALGYRMTRRIEIALLSGAMALLLPWTFEPTRLAMEVALMPALVAGFLLALHVRPPGETRWSFVLLAGILALLTYTYTLGRLLGPLLALGLVLYATRDRWRPVLATWTVYGVLLIPFVLFYLTSPDAALVRLNEADYLNRPFPEIARTFVVQLIGNLDPYRWLVSGDPNLRHHAPAIGGPMLVGVLAFGLIGLVVAVRRARADAFARYLLFGLAVSLIPASLTLTAFHQHRLIAVPVVVIALTIYAQDWLLAKGPSWSTARKGVFAVLALAVLLQGAWFQVRYDTASRNRGGWFDAHYPRLLDMALATGEDPIYLEEGIAPTYIHAYWYGALRGVPVARFERLPRAVRAPSGALVLSSVRDCTPCEQLAEGGFYRLYRVP